VIKNSIVDENDEQSGIISLEENEIQFNYPKKEFGYYRLLITNKIS